MKTVGIIGGGQLGRMMTISAKQMGLNVIVLDPTPNSPCGQVADKQIVANYDNLNKLEELCKLSDVVTYEFENIPYEVVENFEAKYNIPQGHKPLKLSQHRFVEKTSAIDAGLKCGKFKLVKNKEELDLATKNIGYPCVLKTCTGGYDGKGQVVLKKELDLKECYELIKNKECILEEFINFDKEISVIVTRSINGEVSVLPVSENIHKNNILHMSVIPSNISSMLSEKAKRMALQLIEKLELIGTLAVEMFVCGDDVYFNEMAPRPHNSGHYSIEGCYTSQFEQHIRAILGMKLGSTELKHNTIMINVLGQHLEGMEKLMKSDDFKNCKIHLYGKEEAKYNRKMGHVTFINTEYKYIVNVLKKYWT